MRQRRPGVRRDPAGAVLGVVGTAGFAVLTVWLAADSGWWRLLAVVPLGLVVIFAYGVVASTRSTYRNEYGVAVDADADLVALRPVEDADADALFEQQRDPEAVWMAAFTSFDSGDRAAFDAHLARLRADPEVTLRAVTYGGRLVGTVSAFVSGGETEVTYWIDRAVWGCGVATRALTQLLTLLTQRPLYARSASDNVGSLRVLAKLGFVPVSTAVSYAPGREAEVEETILRLDAGSARVDPSTGSREPA